MSELSEKQLLLLDNFMYIENSTKEGSTVDTIVNDLLATGIDEKSLSGGVTKEQALDILHEIKDDPELCKLTVQEAINTDGVRASCFVDGNGDATVAFRGTGGSYEAWNDNLLGEYMEDTPCQKKAADFIRDKCAKYDNITVTGHSKGGNMAQYCTVVLGDKIDRCVSIDGQGFDRDFLTKYENEIAAAKGKITTIACTSDYVNILMHSISGKTKYLETEDGANPHSSWELYTKNADQINKNGEFIARVPQAGLLIFGDFAVDALCDRLSSLPDNVEQWFTDLLASDVGLIFALTSDKMSWEVLWDAIMDRAGAVVKLCLDPLYIRLKEIFEGQQEKYDAKRSSAQTKVDIVTGNIFAGNSSFSVKTTSLCNAASDIDTYAKKLNSIATTVSGIKLQGIYSAAITVNASLKELSEDIRLESKQLAEFSKTLEKCSQLYKTTEANICSNATF